MTDLFCGGEIGGFTPSTSSVLEDDAPEAFDSGFARCAIYVASTGSYGDSPEFSGQTDIWIHEEIRNGLHFGDFPFLGLLNSSGTEVLRLGTSGDAITWQMERWTGAVWAAYGTTVAVSTARQTLDLHIDIANDTVEIYVSGTLRQTITGTDLSTLTDIAQIRLRSTTSSFHSQIIASTSSTIGRRLMTAVPTGDGTTNQWTASYTSVDELVYSDTDFIFSGTANQVELMVVTPVGSTSGYTIQGVAVNARANTDGSGPQNLRLAVRGGSTTEISGSDLPLLTGYGAYCVIFANDPSTTLPWASISGLQVGVKSIA